MKCTLAWTPPWGWCHTVGGHAGERERPQRRRCLLYRQEHAAFGGAGYQGVHKRLEATGPTWHVAMRPSLRKKLNPFIETEFVAERIEKMKTGIPCRGSSIRSACQDGPPSTGGRTALSASTSHS